MQSIMMIWIKKTNVEKDCKVISELNELIKKMECHFGKMYHRPDVNLYTVIIARGGENLVEEWVEKSMIILQGKYGFNKDDIKISGGSWSIYQQRGPLSAVQIEKVLGPMEYSSYIKPGKNIDELICSILSNAFSRKIKKD